MKEIVDLYSKILIGIFSFIGPSFTLLIPIYYQAILRSHERHIATIEDLYSIFLDMKNVEPSIKKQPWIINDYRKLLRQYRKEIQLLDPIRQIRRLFLSLCLAITSVLVCHFLNSPFLINKSLILEISTLSLSVVAFAYCLVVL